MRRWAFNLTTVLSLLLCVGTAVLWVRSYWKSLYLEWENAPHRITINGTPATLLKAFSVACRRGSLWITQSEDAFSVDLISGDRHAGLKSDSYTYPAESVDEVAHIRPVLGLALYRWENDFGADAIGHHGQWGFHAKKMGVAVPYWLLVFVTGWPVACWCVATVRWYRMHRPAKRNVCVVCGYDLRATADRCPECGTITAAPTKPAL